MIIKNFLCRYLILIVNCCYGQFIYTESNYSNALKYNHLNYLSKDSKQLKNWNDYIKAKSVLYKNPHHFGIFLNYHNFSNSNIVQEKSDLIGNGFLTNYRFNLRNFEVSNSTFFTHDYNEAKKGFVRTIKNITMYTNQAYFKYTHSLDSLNISFKLGRDFLIEGYGIDAKLFFSDYSRPFDQLTLNANYKNINGKISAITLDDIGNYERYLYMHSFNFTIKRLDFTVGEAIISSNVDESIDIKYLNPFNFWSWENIGSTTNGLNAFLYSGMNFEVNSLLNFYFEILIDDINFHQSNAFYLNRYAYLIGLKFLSYPFNSSLLWVESSNVLNQVYQSYDPSHTFTHIGYPIGHYLGNDFINYRIHYSQILKSKNKKVFFDFLYLIKGKNSLETPFENPWENNSGEFNINYKHPGFPTPPIRHIYDFNFGIELKINDLTYLTICIENQKKSKNHNSTNLKIRFWSYLNVLK